MIYTFNSVSFPCICGDVNLKRIFNAAIEDAKILASKDGKVTEVKDLVINEESKSRYVAGLTIEIYRPAYADYNELTICLSVPRSCRPIIYRSAMHIKKKLLINERS